MTDEDREQIAATEAALLAAVDEGWVELLGVGEDGQAQWRLTEAGRARVESMTQPEEER